MTFFLSFFQCSFSNGGHLFAAVHGNVIQLYSSTTFENVGNLKGHNGKVENVSRFSLEFTVVH